MITLEETVMILEEAQRPLPQALERQAPHPCPTPPRRYGELNEVTARLILLSRKPRGPAA
jgi:hypothetical protein